jgi:hypothetical protein
VKEQVLEDHPDHCTAGKRQIANGKSQLDNGQRAAYNGGGRQWSFISRRKDVTHATARRVGPEFQRRPRPEVVNAIADALRAHAAVRLLDIESDASHNRSVFTLAAPPEAIVPALFDAIKTAADLIDMNHHQGEHPRLGATDVVPLVPLRGVAMADCVALAKELERGVGEELGIPVYLYEAAATWPDRVNLADIRRGETGQLRCQDGAGEPVS